jgi:hypothetical protein
VVEREYGNVEEHGGWSLEERMSARKRWIQEWLLVQMDHLVNNVLDLRRWNQAARWAVNTRDKRSNVELGELESEGSRMPTKDWMPAGSRNHEQPLIL